MARLPPTTAEQRLQFHEDVRELISPGFLTARIQINNKYLCLRSPYPTDYWLMEKAFGLEERDWTLGLIARLVWMVDGITLFGNLAAQAAVKELLKSLPKTAFDAIFACALGLMARASRARDGALYFLYEEISRDMWRGYGHQLPNADHLTGILHLEKIGLNAVQKIWYAWNTAEDQRTKDMFAWQMAKQQIAPHAPKAVEKIDKADKLSEETREKDRQKQLDAWFYKTVGVLDTDGKLVSKTGDVIDPFAGDQVNMAYTSDELADEMKRWVTGDMDYHDKVVGEYKAQIKDRMLADRSARDQALAEAAQEIQEREDNLGVRPRTRLVGYTGDQVAEMMKDGGFDVDRPGARTVSYPTSRKESAFDKWVDSEKSAGALVEEDGKLVARKEIPKPKKDDRNLQDKITSRLPRYSGGD